MKSYQIQLCAIATFLFCAASSPLFAAASPQERADDFLKLVNASYQALYRVENEAQWLAATDVTPEHDTASETAGKARAAFNGNPAVITEARELLKEKSHLKPVTVRELEQVLLNAAEGPMTNPRLVADRIAAETKQASTLNGFEFKLKGKPITVNQIDDLLQTSTNLDERKEVWAASKESGPALKPGLVALRDLRNGCARELGHSDYFALQVAAYRMSSEEMIKLQDEFMRELRPLSAASHLGEI
jgi:peptidyl-dipeptidase A